MAEFSKSDRTKRRKIQRLAEKHLFDVLNVNDTNNDLLVTEGSDSEFNHDALSSESAANVCMPTCSYTDPVVNSAGTYQ